MCISNLCSLLLLFFFVKQKTAYEMRISDWSSDVCSSDLRSSAEPGSQPDGCDHHDQTRYDARGVMGTAGLEGKHRLHQGVAREANQDRPDSLCARHQIGRASCRERVCQYVEISVVAVSLKKNKHIRH